MNRVLMAVVAFAAAVSLTAIAADEKVPATKEIMSKGMKGALPKIAGAAKSEKLDSVAAEIKTLKAYGEALGKNKPNKGDEASWKKLTDAFKASTAAVAAAAEKKDAKAAAEAAGAIQKSCGGCHGAHK
jgi:cytochrome c556